MNLMKLRKLMQFKSDTLHIAFWLILFAAIVNFIILIIRGPRFPACHQDALDTLMIVLASPWCYIIGLFFTLFAEFLELFLKDTYLDFLTNPLLFFCFIPFFCNLSILVLLNAYYEKVKKITKIGFKGLLFLWCMVILQIFVVEFLKGTDEVRPWLAILTFPWSTIFEVVNEFHYEYSSFTPFAVINAIILLIFTIRYFVKKRRIAKAEG